jgi:large subunit ribosomal protein L27Ae
MPTRLRKSRKLRGQESMGYGRVGKHRKSPGGAGNAGGLHHTRTWFDRYHPGYFGKVGMRRFRWLPCREWSPTINVDKLWTLVAPDIRERAAGSGSGGPVPVIDCVANGFFKVTGRGDLPKIPFIVRAKDFTEGAEKKIRAAGGVCEKVK